MWRISQEELFRLAVEKYSDTVYRAAVHHCSSTADAEDVVQDVFEKLLRYHHAARGQATAGRPVQYKDGGPPKGARRFCNVGKAVRCSPSRPARAAQAAVPQTRRSTSRTNRR